MTDDSTRFWELGAIYLYTVFVTLCGWPHVNRNDLFICIEIIRVPHEDTETMVRLANMRTGRIYHGNFAESYFQKIT